MNKYLIALNFVLTSLFVFGQDSLVKDENEPEAEFHVAINPIDTNNIIIGTIHGFRGENNIRVHYTYDFGNTWSTSNSTGEPAGYSGAGDPVVAFNKEGQAWLVNLAATDPFSEVNALLSKSTDGGATWGVVSEVATGFTDKPWLAIDKSENSPSKGNIYLPIVENQIHLYSLNSNNETINDLIISDGFALPSVVIGSDGDIYTSTVGINDPNQVFIQHFTDGGARMLHSTEVTSFPDYTFGAPWISERFQPTAYLAIDNSGLEYDGRLYLAYTASESEDPKFFDVFLSYSDDGGLTWTTPKVVHDSTPPSTQQFYSSIYVNNKGILLMDWYDQRNHDSASKLTDFYLGMSFDGGASFSEVQLNSVASDFNEVIPSSNDFGIGEYHQVVATDNTALSFWSDGRTNDGDLNIYMAKVNIAKATVSVEEVAVISNKISISQSYPQPIVDNLKVDLDLSEGMNLKYEILNNQGQLMEGVSFTKYAQGKHTLTVPFAFSAGSYFVRIASDNGFFKTMKVLKN